MYTYECVLKINQKVYNSKSEYFNKCKQEIALIIFNVSYPLLSLLRFVIALSFVRVQMKQKPLDFQNECPYPKPSVDFLLYNLFTFVND